MFPVMGWAGCDLPNDLYRDLHPSVSTTIVATALAAFAATVVESSTAAAISA
jgi:hypothetical protein